MDPFDAQTYVANSIQPVRQPLFPIVPMSRLNAIIDILIMFFVLGVFAAYTAITDLQSRLMDLVPSGGLYLWVLINGFLALTTISLILASRRQKITTLGLGVIPPKLLLLGTLAAVPCCYLVGVICSMVALMISGQNLMQMAQERTSFLAYISNVPIKWVVPIVLFVGLYEEILFRGFLLPRLFALLPGPTLPIVAASVIFGLVHFTQGPVFMAQTAGVGAVLAIVALRTRSLWPGILTHATIDGVSLVISIVLLPEIEKLLQSATSAPASMPN